MRKPYVRDECAFGADRAGMNEILTVLLLVRVRAKVGDATIVTQSKPDSTQSKLGHCTVNARRNSLARVYHTLAMVTGFTRSRRQRGTLNAEPVPTAESDQADWE